MFDLCIVVFLVFMCGGGCGMRGMGCGCGNLCMNDVFWLCK